jgi:hypothetical protein
MSSSSILTALCLFLSFVLSTTASAQGFLPRGDTNCDAQVTAADLVGAALGAISGCDNLDCDRDGVANAADLTCAANCLFGGCPIISNGPTFTDIVPVRTVALSPLSVARLNGVTFNAGDFVQVTVGGFPAEISDSSAANTVDIIIPADVPVGDAPVAVTVGDVPGPAKTVRISAPSSIPPSDTYADTLDVLYSVVYEFTELDLESLFPLQAAALRQVTDQALSDLDDASIEADSLDGAERARLDAAMDASGTPDLLNDAFLELYDVAHPESLIGRGGATSAVRAAVLRGARTLVNARTLFRAARGPKGVLGAGVTLASLASLLRDTVKDDAPPWILGINFEPRVDDLNMATVGGKARVIGGNINPANAALILTTASGALALRPEFVDGQSMLFALPGSFEQTFCGAVEFSLLDVEAQKESHGIRELVHPILRSVTPSDPIIGTPMTFDLVASRACLEQTVALFRQSEPGVVSRRLSASGPVVAAIAPDLALGGYDASVSVGGAASRSFPITLHPLRGIQADCTQTQLSLAPGTPKVADCRSVLDPSNARLPDESFPRWSASDTSVVGVTDFEDGRAQFTALKPGTSQARVTLICVGSFACGDAALVDTADITVRDASSPHITLSSAPVAGDVAPGSTIRVTASASDNYDVATIRLTAVGDAVQDPGEQTFTCLGIDEQCETEFTVTLKSEGFSNRTVAINAEAADPDGNKGSATPLIFNVTSNADNLPPSVTIQTPVDLMEVSPGATVQVSVHATDDRRNDKGVKQILIRAEGDALAFAVNPEVECLEVPLGDYTRTASFTVKDLNHIGSVADRRITITVQAVDAAGPGCEGGNKSPIQFVRVDVVGGPPHIGNLPSSVNAGADLSIIGTGFGDTQGASQVFINGTPVIVRSWSSTFVVVTVPETLSGQNLPVAVRVAGFDSNEVTTNVLGTGDVQITLVWEDANDLDLRVTDPFGNIITYDHPTSPTGGELDVDANAICEINVSSSPRENVFWPVGRAPRGEYRVRVEYFFPCTHPSMPTHYSVVVRVDGATYELGAGTLDVGGRVELTFSR